MSKRLCVPLPRASQRKYISLPQCSRQVAMSTARGDNLHTRRTPPRIQRRNFSSSPHCLATSPVSGHGKKQKSAPSFSVAQKRQQAEAQRDGTILDYVGILQGTYVPPTGQNLPSLIDKPRLRMKVEWNRLKNLVKYFQSLFSARFLVQPRLKLEVRKVPKIAQSLYEDLYKNFAKDDLLALQGRVSSGFLGSLRNRISQRQPNTSLEWTLHRYLENPRCVSMTFGLLDASAPKGERNGVVQAIVRVRSQQSLQKMMKMRVIDEKTGRSGVEVVPVTSDGKRIPPSQLEESKLQNAKDVTEYLVVQKFLRAGREGPWHLWGMAEETTMAKLARDQKGKEKMLMTQSRLQQ